MTLLEDVVEAAGGFDRWNQVSRFTLHMSIDGPLFTRKNQPGRVKDVVVEGATRIPTLSIVGFGGVDERCIYRPESVLIERSDGKLLAKRRHRDAIARDLCKRQQWDELDLASFCARMIWTMVVVPFLLAEADVAVRQLEPWAERDESWDRLQAILPSRTEAIALNQILYFDRDRRQRRVDYHAENWNGIGMARRTSAHETFSGICLPTLSRCLEIDAAGNINPQPLVDLEVFDADFE
jgi:hypothetical protein